MTPRCLLCLCPVPCKCDEQLRRDQDDARARLSVVAAQLPAPFDAIETGDLAALRPFDPNATLIKGDLAALRQELRETKNILLQILGELRRR
jgi:hypothetical protein